MKQTIDFVIIWVDGNDPEWQKERSKYKENGGGEDNRSVRFRDTETLKYWFRAVENYAPWVNKIYFVTWGHVPSWLNTENPKLKVVNHKDFIPAEYLPTFSSHVIELNLHRIKGLSEQFVYFNDDMFIINPVKKTDFFKKGLPCDSAILSPAIMEDKFGIGNVELNNMGIINTHFDKNQIISSNKLKWYSPKYEMKHLLKNILLKPWNSFTSFYEFHVCSKFLKSTFEEVWEKEFDALNTVCLHRFRDLKLDNNQWLMRDWQLVSGRFVPDSTKFGRLYTLDNDSRITPMICDKGTKAICLNDSDELTDEEFNSLKKRMQRAFEHKLPEKSSFEK